MERDEVVEYKRRDDSDDEFDEVKDLCLLAVQSIQVVPFFAVW
jgi:hypothetical protein